MWFDPAQLMQYADAPPATLAIPATFTHAPTVNDGKVAEVARIATTQEVKTANPGPVEVYCNPEPPEPILSPSGLWYFTPPAPLSPPMSAPDDIGLMDGLEVEF